MDFKVLDPFPTPILVKRWPDCGPLNQRLTEAIHRRREAEAGVVASNRGGWHSKTDLKDWDEPVVAEFQELVTQLSRDFIRTIIRLPEGCYDFEWRYHTWCVVNGKGDFNIPHCHPTASWSAVYYVRAEPPPPEHPESGMISLQDPRTGIAGVRPEAIYGHRWHDVMPETGMMMMWPGWLTHFVHPYQGEGERIVIAVDVVVTGERYHYERMQAASKAALTP